MKSFSNGGNRLEFRIFQKKIRQLRHFQAFPDSSDIITACETFLSKRIFLLLCKSLLLFNLDTWIHFAGKILITLSSWNAKQ